MFDSEDRYDSASGRELPELRFLAVDADGRHIECETLFLFDSPVTGKNYIVYTDNTVDEEGCTRVYASVYNPASLSLVDGQDIASLELTPIETDFEWGLVSSVLSQAQDDPADEDDGIQPVKTASRDVINVKPPKE